MGNYPEHLHEFINEDLNESIYQCPYTGEYCNSVIICNECIEFDLYYQK